MRGAVIILYFVGMNNYVHSAIDECWLISFVISNYQILLSHNSIKAIIKWHLVSLFSIWALATRYLSFHAYILGFLIKTSSENATHKTQPKIIGGQPIDIKYRSFMVNIIFYLYLPTYRYNLFISRIKLYLQISLHNSYGFLCGASILSRTWAITALHCL